MKSVAAGSVARGPSASVELAIQQKAERIIDERLENPFHAKRSHHCRDGIAASFRKFMLPGVGLRAVACRFCSPGASAHLYFKGNGELERRCSNLDRLRCRRS